MPCIVSANLGTTLEHLVLSEAIKYLCDEVMPANEILHYIDTHAMCPMNTPHNHQDLWRDLWVKEWPNNLIEMSPFFQIVWNARVTNRQRYPSHFVFAAKTAQLSGRQVWASLFEIAEEKLPHIEQFLLQPQIIAGQDLDQHIIRGTLGRGDFRLLESWQQASLAVQEAGLVPAARLVFCDPMSYKAGGIREANRCDKMDHRDLALLRERIVMFGQEDLPTFIVLFTFRMGWGNFEANAGEIAGEFAHRLFTEDLENTDWTMVHVNNPAIFVMAHNYPDGACAHVRERVNAALVQVRDWFGRPWGIEWA